MLTSNGSRNHLLNRRYHEDPLHPGVERRQEGEKVNLVPILERILLKYIEDHPEVIEQLVTNLFDRLVKQIAEAAKPASN